MEIRLKIFRLYQISWITFSPILYSEINCKYKNIYKSEIQHESATVKKCNNQNGNHLLLPQVDTKEVNMLHWRHMTYHVDFSNLFLQLILESNKEKKINQVAFKKNISWRFISKYFYNKMKSKKRQSNVFSDTYKSFTCRVLRLVKHWIYTNYGKFLAWCFILAFFSLNKWVE